MTPAKETFGWIVPEVQTYLQAKSSRFDGKIDAMNCEKCTYNVADYVAGALGDEERAAFERAIGTCESCSEELAHLQNIASAMSAPRVLSMPKSRRESLMELAAEEVGGLSRKVVSIGEDSRRSSQLLWLLPAVAVFAAVFAWLLIASNPDAPSSGSRGDRGEQVAVAESAPAPAASRFGGAAREGAEYDDSSTNRSARSSAEAPTAAPEFEAVVEDYAPSEEAVAPMPTEPAFAEPAPAQPSLAEELSADVDAEPEPVPERQSVGDVARSQRQRTAARSAPAAPNYGGAVLGGAAGRGGGASTAESGAAQQRPTSVAGGASVELEAQVAEGRAAYAGSATDRDDSAADRAPAYDRAETDDQEHEPPTASAPSPAPSRRASDSSTPGDAIADEAAPSLGVLRTLYATGDLQRYLRESSALLRTSLDSADRAEIRYFRGRIYETGDAAEREYVSAIRAAPMSRWGRDATRRLAELRSNEPAGDVDTGSSGGSVDTNESATEPK